MPRRRQQPRPLRGGLSTTQTSRRGSTNFGRRGRGRDTGVPDVIPGGIDQAEDMVLPGGEPDSTPVTPTVDSLVADFQEQGDDARAANEERYAQGLGIHEQLVSDFGQGGTLEAAMMQQYGRQKTRDLASQKQHMIGSGLFNTTIAAGMPAAYEEQVGNPFRLQMADLLAQRQAGAMEGQAGFIERREDTGPSPELMASLVQTASSRPDETATPDGTTTSSELTQDAAGTPGTGGIDVPSMSEVGQQYQFTPEHANVSFGGVGTSSLGSSSGGGAMSSDDFSDAISDAYGGSGSSTTTTQGAATTDRGSGVSVAGDGAPGAKIVSKRFSGGYNVRMPNGGMAVWSDEKVKNFRDNLTPTGSTGAAGTSGASTGAATGASAGTLAGAAFGPLGAAAGGVLGSLAGRYLGGR